MESIFYLVSKGDYVNKKTAFCYYTFSQLFIAVDSIRKLNDLIRFEFAFDSNQFELH